MENTKQERVLEIFFRSLRGEDISVQKLADEYKVSNKSISRSINELKNFLADHRDMVGNTELQYSYQDKCYRLYMDDFFSNKEIFSIVEVLIGARAFHKKDLLTLTDKFKKFTTPEDRTKLTELIRREVYYYPEIKHDCSDIQSNVWQLVNCIDESREISIEYHRMDRNFVTHRLRPASIMFTDYYFYLIAFKASDTATKPVYFRIDRIQKITKHRTTFSTENTPQFNEGVLRQKSLFMWPGKIRRVRFEFTGPSVQAVLDKLPTAKIIDRDKGKYIIEAETTGDGIKMFLLSQGSWVKVIEPEEFVGEIKAEITKMNLLY